ncbi:MAG: DnaJ domain-containing protein [Saprospiraceae bacterium]|nr:DnaJ domain-containing protein [Saprospiraceae bacterium]
MFKDYYQILGIRIDATQAEVKAAFKRQAKRWHPDRNPNVDTTALMQDINEAHLILIDMEARSRYNDEYQKYKKFKHRQTVFTEQDGSQDKFTENQSRTHSQDSSENQSKSSTHHFSEYKSKTTTHHEEYKVEDEILERWMNNARRQATEIVRDFKGMAKEGFKAGAQTFIIQFLIMLMIGFFAMMYKMCYY